MYVLLAFDNDEAAKEYVRDLQSQDEEGFQVAGMYKKPTIFCDPLDGNHKANRRVVGFTKGTRWGWWVCAICHKPTKNAWKDRERDTSFGYNLLPKE